MIDTKIIVSAAIGCLLVFIVWEMFGATQMINKDATAFGSPKTK